MKIAVSTPTGRIGRALTDHLLDAGAEVVVLARNPEKVKDLASRGAAVRAGSLEDSKFVGEATRGIDTLFWLTPPHATTVDYLAFQSKLARFAAGAVEKNGIARVVNLSSIGAHLPGGTGPIAGLHQVEGILDRAGANVTHVRAGFFMENFFMTAESMHRGGVVYMPLRGSARIEMIATRDIAEAVARRMRDTTWAGRTVIELVGPAERSFEDAVRTLGITLGKDVNFITTTLDQARSAFTGMGISAPVADLFCEMYAAVDAGRVAPEFPAGVIRTPTTLEAFAREVFRPGVEAMMAGRK